MVSSRNSDGWSDIPIGQCSGSQPSVRDYFSPMHSKVAINPLLSNEYTDCAVAEMSLNKYLNEKAISEMINVNSEITRILNKFKVSIKINMGILNNLVQNHLADTRKIAMGIADNLPHNFQSSLNRKALAEATTLHDIAKAIIPENIVNKEGALTEAEREIMKEHATLSYELLKSTDLSEETLNLIKNHHEPESLEEQILSMADIYSALREKRCYKAEMTNEQALAIIAAETEQGKFHSVVYDALVEYANSVEKLAQVKPKWQIFNFKFVNGFGA